EVTAIKQIGIAIFAQCNHETGRGRAGNVHEQWTGTTQIQVAIVELLPIGGYPVIAGIAAEDRARLKTNHCFAATLVSVSVTRVTSRNEWIAAFTGHATDSPYRAALGACSPCCDISWIIY